MTEQHPFVTYRACLTAWRRWQQADGDLDGFAAIVAQLDDAVTRVDGRGIVATALIDLPAASEAVSARVVAKVEATNVSGSHKSRHLFGVMLDLLVQERIGARTERAPLAIASCGNAALADDLAQQVFLQVWLKIATLKKAGAFGGWLKRLSVNTWLQHRRRKDALKDADEHRDEVAGDAAKPDPASVSMDLDHCLSKLADEVRLCVVLSYHEGQSHREVAVLTGIPLGTVKSHINRGSERLRACLSAYRDIEAEAVT